MCLIGIAWRAHPRFALLVAANRDEFHARPTVAAALQEDAPDVFGGRDLQAGGSWLQLSTRRRLAAVTNYRQGAPLRPATGSRGALVAGFVRAQESAEALARRANERVGPHTLLLWDGHELWQSGNHPAAHAEPIAAGVHALSNAALDAQWPKSVALSAAIQRWIDSAGSVIRPDVPDTEPLFAALADPSSFPDKELPGTGVPIEWERRLSAAFIRGNEYGTRASTVVLVDQQGAMSFEERRFGPDGVDLGRTRWQHPASA